MIIWAGTSNLDVGMVVEHYPKVIIPQRSQEVQQVPGRNGNIVLSNGSFENYEQQYSVFLDAKYIGHLEQVMPKIVNWLLGNEGYHRLEDSYFPDVYRMAYYSGGTEFVSIFNEYGEGTLSFNCAPEKFYKEGENPIRLENGQVLRNPSVFDASPLLMVYGSGSGTVLFNNKTFTLNSFIPTGYTNAMNPVYIDVKLHKTYTYANDMYAYFKVPTVEGSYIYYTYTTKSAVGSGQENFMVMNTDASSGDLGGTELPMNDKVTGYYEDLKLGKLTTVSWTGGITGVNIVPRWWTI